MIRTLIFVMVFLGVGSKLFADGFSPMSLEDVLLETDAITFVEIVGNKQKITYMNKGQGNLKESTVYTNDIKSKVLTSHVGDFAEKVFNTNYVQVLTKGVWLSIPGSGIEGKMKAGEKYVFLLKKGERKYSLLRAEKAEMLKQIVRIKKRQIEAGRRLIQKQKSIPDGIYYCSEAAMVQVVRLSDGRHAQIGMKCKTKPVRKELHSRYNMFLLTLTMSDKPKQTVLMVDGNGYWLFDHHWAAVTDNGSDSEGKPALYCSFDNEKDAKAVAKHFNISIVYPEQ